MKLGKTLLSVFVFMTLVFSSNFVFAQEATVTPQQDQFGFAVVPICDWDDALQTCILNGDYAVYFICGDTQMEADVSQNGEFKISGVEIRSQLVLEIQPNDSVQQNIGEWEVVKQGDMITASFRGKKKITFTTDTTHGGC